MNLTTLEQSKKLKEWGTPQDTIDYVWTQNSTTKSTMVRDAALKIPEEWTVLCATYDLGSLITWLPKAVDGEFGISPFTLQFVGGTPVTEKWAGSYENELGAPYMEFGETPLEAVFNLCQAVHGKEEA